MIENVNEIWIAAGVVLGVIGTASGWIKDHYSQIKLVAEKALNRDLNGTVAGIIDLMSSDVPQTEEQTKLIRRGIVPAETWKMNDARKEELFATLRNWGAEIRRADLLAVIAKAEAESQVEYGIILHDHNGDIDRSIINKGKGPDQEHEVYHVFVSYGRPEVQVYESTMAKVKETSSKTYPLEVYWYMTDAEKEMLIQSIGYNNPKCIADAQATIKEAEEKQWESYYVGCGIHTFKIEKGNLTQIGANPKTEQPKAAAEIAATT